jgi:hypothetical protein
MPTVEDQDAGEDREIAEHPRPPQVPPTRAVRGAEERQEVVDDSAHAANLASASEVTPRCSLTSVRVAIEHRFINEPAAILPMANLAMRPT